MRTQPVVTTVIVGLLAVIAVSIILGMVGTLPTVSHNELPACMTEDQVTPDCRWDADTQGNGKGRSFEVRDGEVTYVE